MSSDQDPIAWSKARESEGWHVLGCADHFWSADRQFPHLWVTLATMAAHTTKPRITSSFANNLFRSPVEFAQASLQMQAVSGGRFEAGLGAGWTQDEIEAVGWEYPPAGRRAERYIEAVQVVRALLSEGSCSFSGSHYRISVPAIGPRPTAGPPPLVASVGGARTIRGVAPLVDRVELKLISAATRNGKLDVPALASIPRDHLLELIAKVRDVNPTVPLGVFILCSIGTDPRTRALADLLGDSFLGGFFGEATKVADSMHALADAGISRVQVSPMSDTGFSLLAPYLF